MGVYIPKMTMPTRCEKCDLAYDDDGYFACPFTKAFYKSKQRPSWCPLVEVKPHGRLIDEENICGKLRPLIENPYCYNRLQIISETLAQCLQIISDAPTVIESEGE